ncbi:uncharacterized protein LTR77_001045 [Saxophila tyrrhenica]|uniref:Uncharacterized protein n=1 Tax=Saxophila tyrrhenica TaxID=1690608 RepID=A0AAV9PR06_9PEZI|nr:hypothetical protein LTR77_001045 [Saxophila tyrrhenica]
MVLADFFWLDDAKFAEALRNASDAELMFDDKHNVRKRKGGKLGAWVGTVQAPLTLGISLVGTGIAARNRVVAKRRLTMIHEELGRRGLQKHAEDWFDAAFAMMAVGAGTVVGMSFVPGAEFAAQEFAKAGATQAAMYFTGVATSEVLPHVGSLATETATSQWSNPDNWHSRPSSESWVQMVDQKYTYTSFVEMEAPIYVPAPRYPITQPHYQWP